MLKKDRIEYTSFLLKALKQLQYSLKFVFHLSEQKLIAFADKHLN